ncbi:TonB-dependent receptor [Coraliomargarita sp. SDUM461004]|uniref:TonB-dependent receptor n=1 Tax=Thalassobacterium sedimentorum TaxID=3041258 RepID=A0ABU1AK31_9BACT|nr:TonB-dependent receptor [Coraliomargarita sp. SDUM461004]MDQ8195004.1 TonB-dependent receptor [Coraliomargarita sp. SDUM461004]
MSLIKYILAACLGCLYTLAESSLEPSSVYSLPEYTVTAWHFDSGSLSVPADVVTVDREAIENSAARSLPDLLQSEANLVFRSFNGKGNEGEVAMRGFGEGSGMRVLILVDGIKVNRADMGNIEWQQLSLRDIESVEVLRGGQNVLYGNHALSGVIKITTRKGGDDRASLSAFTGSFGYQNLDASQAGSVGDFYYRLNVNDQRDEGYRDQSLSRSRGGKLSFGYFLGENDELSSSFAYNEGYVEFPGPLTLTEFEDDPTQSQGGEQYSESENYRYTFSWLAQRDWGELETHGGYNRRDLVWELDGIYGDNDQQGFSLTPKFKLGNATSFIVLGFDVLYDTIDFLSFTDDSRQYVKADAALSRWTSGAYLFAQHELSSPLQMSGGLRYERATTDYDYRKFDESQLSPYDPILTDPFNPNPNFKYPADLVEEESYRDELTKDGWAAELSLNYRVSETLSLWLGYDRVYRYPVLDEVAAYQGFPLSKPLNDDLEPEVGDNFESGLKYFTDRWEASVTLFHLSIDNEIVYDDVVNLNTNIGATRRVGADWMLRYTGENWGASTQWSWVDARLDYGDVAGNRVPLVAKFNSVSQAWFQPFKPLRVSLVMNYMGDRYVGNDYENSGERLPAYVTYDTQIAYELKQFCKLFLRVNNLLDHQYVSSAYQGGYYPAAGRSFVVGMNVHF